MNSNDILTELEKLGSLSTKNTLLKHGAKEPFWGVKVGDMKPILKKIKHQHDLAMQLYATCNSDAQYLAGLAADGSKMSKEEIQTWLEKAQWQMISEYSVPWVATESKYGLELALEWIESDIEYHAAAGWATLSSIVSYKSDSELDLNLIHILLLRVEKQIHDSANRVKYNMNSFVIAVGSGVADLNQEAMRVANAIGKVNVFMGKTACKVPYAPDYIQKVMNMGRVGFKRKEIKC